MRKILPMKFFLRHIELCLTLAGLGAVLLAIFLLQPASEGAWRTVAIISTVAGVFHGVIAWAVQRQKSRRQRIGLCVGQSLLHGILDREREMAAQLKHAGESIRNHAKPVSADIVRLVTAVSDVMHQVSIDSPPFDRPDYLTLADEANLSVGAGTEPTPLPRS